MASSRVCLAVWLVLLGLLAIQATAESAHESESDSESAQLAGHQSHGGVAGGEADGPVSSESDGKEEAEEAEAPSIRRLAKHRSDKSVAGGGVIIGGLATAIFAAVFFYIRVTRKRNTVL